jgi:hypothetical protein
MACGYFARARDPVSRRVAKGDYSIEYSHRLGEFILP